jgi:ribosomal protein S18 acetylase RimI-like enzyme
MQISIRQALATDAQAISDISERTFRDTYTVFNTPENMEEYVRTYFSLEQVSTELADPQNTFLLALEQEEVIGFAKLSTGKIPEELSGMRAIEIERIYVDRQFHGKNVGPLLMEYIVDLATRQAFEVLWLGVWENNPKAFRFYEKWGFTRFGQQVFQLGDDAQTDWLLCKDL